MDEKQESDDPFSINVEVTGRGLTDDWATAQVAVLSGTYNTHGNASGPFNANNIAYPALALDVSVTKAEPKGFVYLAVPLEGATNAADGSALPNSVKAANGKYVRAKEGGLVGLMSYPVPTWPNVTVRGSTIWTYVHIGSWTIKSVDIGTAGVSTKELRGFIQQNVTGNIVLGAPEESGTVDSAQTYTPFAVVSTTGGVDGAVAIPSGYLVPVNLSAANINLGGWTGTLSSGTKVWIEVPITGATPAVFGTPSIQTGAAFPARVVISTNQSQLNIRIGEVESGYYPAKPGFDFQLTGTAYHFTQLLNSHQQLFNACVNGVPCILARGGA